MKHNVSALKDTIQVLIAAVVLLVMGLLTGIVQAIAVLAPIVLLFAPLFLIVIIWTIWDGARDARYIEKAKREGRWVEGKRNR